MYHQCFGDPFEQVILMLREPPANAQKSSSLINDDQPKTKDQLGFPVGTVIADHLNIFGLASS